MNTGRRFSTWTAATLTALCLGTMQLPGCGGSTSGNDRADAGDASMAKGQGDPCSSSTECAQGSDTLVCCPATGNCELPQNCTCTTDADCGNDDEFECCNELFCVPDGACVPCPVNGPCDVPGEICPGTADRLVCAPITTPGVNGCNCICGGPQSTCQNDAQCPGATSCNTDPMVCDCECVMGQNGAGCSTDQDCGADEVCSVPDCQCVDNSMCPVPRIHGPLQDGRPCLDDSECDPGFVCRGAVPGVMVCGMCAADCRGLFYLGPVASAGSHADRLQLTEEEICAATKETGFQRTTLFKNSNGSLPEKEAQNDSTRLEAKAAFRKIYTQEKKDSLKNNSDYDCGMGPNGLTLCPDPDPFRNAGEYVVLFAIFAGDIELASTTNFYQYAFVFDSDNDSSNNYRGMPPFDQDFFDDTDRWYEARYDPAAGWSLEVSTARNGVIREVTNSRAYIVIDQNVIFLVVPIGEFQVQDPMHRVTAFRHTGDFGQNAPFDWDGTLFNRVGEPLLPFENGTTSRVRCPISTFCQSESPCPIDEPTVGTPCPTDGSTPFNCYYCGTSSNQYLCDPSGTWMGGSPLPCPTN